MKKRYWKPMVSAPRDGTVIISVFTDGSGVELMLWGETDCNPPSPCWIRHDDHEILSMGDDYYGGWIPCPTTLGVPDGPQQVEGYPVEEWGISRLEERAYHLRRVADDIEKKAATLKAGA